MSESGFLKSRRKLKPGVVALIVLFHLLALYGLTRAFAPQITDTIERGVVEAFTVTITAPPDDPPDIPDEGMAGNPGEEAVPDPVSAPTPRVTPSPDRDLPQASSTGDAATSGATASGDGTGASGEGSGTGSGDEGSGQGSSMATGPVKIAGTINSARDYPVPDGGREVRFGRSVKIAILVGRDGMPRRCRVFGSSGLPDTDARTCELAMSRFRFEPARNARGQPIEAEFGWEQRFRRAS
jgi:protein TonB